MTTFDTIFKKKILSLMISVLSTAIKFWSKLENVKNSGDYLIFVIIGKGAQIFMGRPLEIA
jgi:hypothetical protein